MSFFLLSRNVPFRLRGTPFHVRHFRLIASFVLCSMLGLLMFCFIFLSLKSFFPSKCFPPPFLYPLTVFGSSPIGVHLRTAPSKIVDFVASSPFFGKQTLPRKTEDHNFCSFGLSTPPERMFCECLTKIGPLVFAPPLAQRPQSARFPFAASHLVTSTYFFSYSFHTQVPRL